MSEVADTLAGLRRAGSGWINLLPGIDDEEAPQPAAGLFAFFSGAAPPVSMATVMPPGGERRTTEGITVGLMHPTGAKAVSRLSDAGVPVPREWRVVQDHPDGVCWCGRRSQSSRATSSPGRSALAPPCVVLP